MCWWHGLRQWQISEIIVNVYLNSLSPSYAFTMQGLLNILVWINLHFLYLRVIAVLVFWQKEFWRLASFLKDKLCCFASLEVNKYCQCCSWAPLGLVAICLLRYQSCLDYCCQSDMSISWQSVTSQSFKHTNQWRQYYIINFLGRFSLVPQPDPVFQHQKCMANFIKKMHFLWAVTLFTDIPNIINSDS